MLVCTVGGTPQPIASTILFSRPHRVLFFASLETAGSIKKDILPILERNSFNLSREHYEIKTLPDSQDITRCIETMREITPDVQQWTELGPDYEVIVDLTGGTKCMSAALALFARRLPCRFSYVGGEERSKNGVGVVVDGREQVIHCDNPWEVLGYQAVEDAVVLFDEGDYQGAADTLEHSLKLTGRADIRSELNSLKTIAEAYKVWDLFEHKEAMGKFNDLQKRVNDLRHLFPHNFESINAAIQKNQEFLRNFKDGKVGRHTLLDLLANARRCASRGRYDDAVARLYRVVEATAQLLLDEKYEMYAKAGEVTNFNKLLLNKMPEPYQSKWKDQTYNGFLILGLQEDFQLLGALGDTIAIRFKGLEGKESPLSARNQSILAHGFTPVGKTVFDQLWQKTLEITEISDSELPVFPTLGAVVIQKRHENDKNSTIR